LIIKRVKKENWGRWGSIFICDREIWYKFTGVWPVGHFVLSQQTSSKLFAWTWTWLVPLFSQIVAGLERGDTSSYVLLFWVRTSKDIFYQQAFSQLAKKYQNFKYHIYLSREEYEGTKKWYITEFITPETTKSIQEAYICGAPWMLEWVVKKLTSCGMDTEDIFTEKY
jgi:ferredoxin-NADP reductase